MGRKRKAFLLFERKKVAIDLWTINKNFWMKNSLPIFAGQHCNGKIYLYRILYNELFIFLFLLFPLLPLLTFQKISSVFIEMCFFFFFFFDGNWIIWSKFRWKKKTVPLSTQVKKKRVKIKSFSYLADQFALSTIEKNKKKGSNNSVSSKFSVYLPFFFALTLLSPSN